MWADQFEQSLCQASLRRTSLLVPVVSPPSASNVRISIQIRQKTLKLTDYIFTEYWRFLRARSHEIARFSLSTPSPPSAPVFQETVTMVTSDYTLRNRKIGPQGGENPAQEHKNNTVWSEEEITQLSKLAGQIRNRPDDQSKAKGHPRSIKRRRRSSNDAIVTDDTDEEDKNHAGGNRHNGGQGQRPTDSMRSHDSNFFKPRQTHDIAEDVPAPGVVSRIIAAAHVSSEHSSRTATSHCDAPRPLFAQSEVEQPIGNTPPRDNRDAELQLQIAKTANLESDLAAVKHELETLKDDLAREARARTNAEESFRKELESSSNARRTVEINTSDESRVLNQRLEEVAKQLQAEVDERREAERILAGKVKRYTEQAESANQATEEFLKRLDKLEQQFIKETESATQAHKKDREEFLKRLDKLEQQFIKETESATQAHKKDIEELSEELNKLEQQFIKESESADQARKKDRGELSEELNKLEQQFIKESESANQARKEDRGELSEELNKLEQQFIKELESANQARNKHREEIFEELNKLKKQFTERLETEAKARNAGLRTIAERCDQIDKQQELVREECLGAANGQKQQLGGEIDALKTRFDEFQNQPHDNERCETLREDLHNRMTRLELEDSNMRVDIDQIKEKAQKAEEDAQKSSLVKKDFFSVVQVLHGDGSGEHTDPQSV
ncbi:uncharacterized protein DSM5745_00733 [Aspergillus mulundensis]|uniref:Uncharacterized protein n=1 Tax=Aspergillus mulundensis TaxID=1810919 RepID=A0A3D8T4M4_9EURO|nr:hypothetical protein DSM5745_00733 [Aspergillus mulundensis]RDW93411.1 hypothetical protein DSM5745_00733 [Aspergillus mulundensis]